MSEKSIIRNQMLQKRQQLTQKDVQIKSKQLIKHLKAHPQYQKSTYIGLFNPIGNELNLLSLFKDVDKIFCFPKIEDGILVFYEVTDQTQWVKSKFGILEPKTGREVNYLLEFLIVPALAISKEKHRIGYGKGYYDRFIETFKPKFTLGVIYDFQEVVAFKVESFDQKLNEYIKV